MKRGCIPLMTICLIAAWLTGCVVISQERMAEALTDINFRQLTENAEAYRGQTVVLGGHVIEVRNAAEQTVILVLQTPLGIGQEPAPPDQSEGRFMLSHQGFLDPEVFTKGRLITMAGRVTGMTREAIDKEMYDYVTLEALEIYLWEQYENYYPYRSYYRSPAYDPWRYHYRWRRYRYW